MPPQFPECRGIRRRVRRTLKYGIRPNSSLSAPMNDLVLNYFDRNSPYDYMRPDIAANISHRGYADPFTFVVAMVYLERLRVTDKDFFEASDPVDLYLPALVLASKFLYDTDTADAASNADWAEVADITVSHMNGLEWEFAKRLNWNTMVKQNEFDQVMENVETYVAAHNLKNTGIATYNELNHLGSAIACSSYMSLLQDFFSYIGMLGVVYIVAACSIIAAPAMVDTPSSSNVSSVETNHSAHVPAAVPERDIRAFSPNWIPTTERPGYSGASRVDVIHHHHSVVPVDDHGVGSAPMSVPSFVHLRKLSSHDFTTRFARIYTFFCDYIAAFKGPLLMYLPFSLSPSSTAPGSLSISLAIQDPRYGLFFNRSHIEYCF